MSATDEIVVLLAVFCLILRFTLLRIEKDFCPVFAENRLHQPPPEPSINDYLKRSVSATDEIVVLLAVFCLILRFTLLAPSSTTRALELLLRLKFENFSVVCVALF